MGITIIGTGHYVPGPPVPNDSLSRVMATDDEWIRPRTGIGPRPLVSEGAAVSDLALMPAQRAVIYPGPSQVALSLCRLSTTSAS